MGKATKAESAVQMDLLDATTLPERPDVEACFSPERLPLLASSAPKALPKHTGKNVIKRLRNAEELAAELYCKLRMGHSIKHCARTCGMSTRSVLNAYHAMMDGGELAPIRRQVDRLLDEVTVIGLQEWRDGMLSGKIHPGQIPIATLAASDKKEAREAGLVGSTARTVEDVSLERAAVGAIMAEIRRRLEATEDRSDARSQNGPIIEVPSPLDTHRDTPASSPAPLQAALPAPGPDQGPQPAGPGGGDRASATGPNGRGDRPENFTG